MLFRRNRIYVKPSKPALILGVIFGIFFILIGVTQALPRFGVFGVFWTLAGVAITGFNVYHLVTGRGAGFYEVDVQSTGGDRTEPAAGDFETKLRKLERLRQDNLITETEYQKKRDEILREKW
ncbi:SHOCT domain-containing protein [Brevibacillus sp. SYP-B805]|uniref:SHOCT domain-containing protein n=1 Tax=Brevibacillus sp. SYP-B805 TaxID=1578199 RepID=UPI0013ECA053|nr:SHOCT domain-containing protein [Brevibacillus sp. SYP-B805]NGQ96813.1 SHOCT domain-containing protein [Brevibacillus sp. SYP-B805]